jgi:LuxR family maltose regulon positive regulatory protein
MPILATKLYIPPPRPNVVLRPCLIERLNEGLPVGRKLTLISAPAGFGKTTLISEWINQKDEPEEIVHPSSFILHPSKVAWLSLDDGDNDPTRFLTYFVAALQTIVPNLGAGMLTALQSPQPPPTETILTSLLNEIAGISNNFIFVLDDYHVIEAKAINQTLTFLLEHLPSQMHLVIATREDPSLPLARYRVRGQLTELRATDLRFSSSEAAEFLNQVMGLNLSAEDIAALETRTEGWIAGLQLAAISMRGHEDTTNLIKSFTGSHRLVLDYLIEEVLEQQSESIQAFLLQTSILNRLTGSLCGAITGQDNGQATLEMLERANLFVVPLDNERRWYRYHHLFADLLRQRLISQNNGVINELHAKAAIWYETNDDLPEAVHHAFAGDDKNLAIRLIEKGALAALENSNFRFILDSVERLPESVLQDAPWLFIYHAWALLLTGHVEDANPKLENIDRLLNTISENDEIQEREMLGNIAGLKMISAGWMRDFENLPEYANQVREYLPENNLNNFCGISSGTSDPQVISLTGRQKTGTHDLLFESNTAHLNRLTILSNGSLLLYALSKREIWMP